MKITIDGVVIEGATVEEAVQLLRRQTSQPKQKETVVSTGKPNYTKRNKTVRSKSFWTEEEVNYILAHIEEKPKQLAKTLKRHTPNAICVMKSTLKTRHFTNHGKYLQKIVNKFHNQNTSIANVPAETKLNG